MFFFIRVCVCFCKLFYTAIQAMCTECVCDAQKTIYTVSTDCVRRWMCFFILSRSIRVFHTLSDERKKNNIKYSAFNAIANRWINLFCLVRLFSRDSLSYTYNSDSNWRATVNGFMVQMSNEFN